MPAIMLYTNHPMLNSADKISERSGYWGGNQVITLDINMESKTLTWTSDTHSGSTRADLTNLGVSVVYPSIYNCIGTCMHEILSVADAE